MEEKKPRGFAAMDPEKQRRAASLGGHAAHAAGTAHRFTEETARKAGKLNRGRKHKKKVVSISEEVQHSVLL